MAFRFGNFLKGSGLGMVTGIGGLTGGLVGGFYGDKIGGPFSTGQEKLNPYQVGQKPGLPDLSTPGSVKDLEQFAKQPGESAYASIARAKLSEQAGQAGEKLRGQALGGAYSSMSRLAQRGGLQSGARERLVEQGMRNLASGQAELQSAALSEGADIGMQDAAKKLEVLRSLPTYGYQDLANRLKLHDLQQQGYLGDVAARNLWEQAQNNRGGLWGSLMDIPRNIFGG